MQPDLSTDAAVHQQIIREVLLWTAEMDLSQPMPVVVQQMHRRLRIDKCQ